MQQKLKEIRPRFGLTPTSGSTLTGKCRGGGTQQSSLGALKNELDLWKTEEELKVAMVK